MDVLTRCWLTRQPDRCRRRQRAFLSRDPVYLGEDGKSLSVQHGDLGGSTGLKPGRTIR